MGFKGAEPLGWGSKGRSPLGFKGAEPLGWGSKGRSPLKFEHPHRTKSLRTMPIKAKIPKALREQVWKLNVGEKYKAKCLVTWCTNAISVFDFEVGHNIPESKGGTLELKNLRPICSRCNKSMGSQYTIDAWNRMGKPDIATGCCLPWC